MRPETWSEDLEACRALLRVGSKSFALAARALPPRVRDPATVIYAFCRIADDLVDTYPHADGMTVSRLDARLRRVYAGGALDHPVDRALSWVVRVHGLPIGVFLALLEGLSWDAAGRRYRTLAELQGYCARVAGTVGVLMSLLMDVRDEETLARACELGVAMQLTNIARDVGEDAGRGRVYLPLEWLAEVGLDADAFVRRPRPGPALASVVRRLLGEAERLYARADVGLTRLPADCQVAIRAARLIYAEIGPAIAAAGWDPVTRRAVVPAWRKAWLLARAAQMGLQSPSAATAAPLEPIRFLLPLCAAGAP